MGCIGLLFSIWVVWLYVFACAFYDGLGMRYFGVDNCGLGICFLLGLRWLVYLRIGFIADLGFFWLGLL